MCIVRAWITLQINVLLTHSQVGKKYGHSSIAVIKEAMICISYSCLDEKGKKRYTGKLSCVNCWFVTLLDENI